MFVLFIRNNSRDDSRKLIKNVKEEGYIILMIESRDYK